MTWEVSDREIATVTVKGVVIAGNRRGQAEIQISDSKNILHKVVGKVRFAHTITRLYKGYTFSYVSFTVSVQVMVVRPALLQLIPQRGDCHVGDRIDIPFALWGIQDPPNTCSQNSNLFSETHNLQCRETLLEDRNLVLVTDCSQLSLHIHTDPAGIFTHMSGAASSPSPSLPLYLLHVFTLHWFLQYSVSLMALSFIHLL